MSAIGGKADMARLASRCRANDPKRTSASISCCSSEAGFSPYQSTRLSRYDVTLSLGADMTAPIHHVCLRRSGMPFVLQAQERVRRIGVLMYTTPDEPESQARVTALAQGLQEAGWAVGRNVRIDTRWSGGDIARLRKDAAELVALGSDVLVAGAGPTTGTLQQATRTVPIVFAQGLDPVGNGFIRSLARPGGNTTGFNQFEYGLSGKWLGLLTEIAPQVSRVGVVRDLEGGPAGLDNGP